jgi:hypothetical protein
MNAFRPVSVSRQAAWEEVAGGVGQDVVELVDAAVNVPSLLREGVVGPSPLDVHQVESPGAVGILMKHVESERAIFRDGRHVGRHQTLLLDGG